MVAVVHSSRIASEHISVTTSILIPRSSGANRWPVTVAKSCTYIFSGPTGNQDQVKQTYDGIDHNLQLTLKLSEKRPQYIRTIFSVLGPGRKFIVSTMTSLSVAQQIVFETYVSYCQRIPAGRVDLPKLRKFIHECEFVCHVFKYSNAYLWLLDQ